MAYRVISLKYRPQDFDQITGQGHIVLSLKGAINKGEIGHAFLFAGPRGVGKTTMARIFAKSLNCINGPTIHPCQECQSCREITVSRSVDVIEIDGASNRGIDEVRNLREGIKYAPLHSRYKVYIIDEVHMLTQEAFNALLKTLEEPPPNVVFILATTNPSKIPATILSRCQRFIFKRLSLSEITTRLKEIAQKEGIKITERALFYLAQRADGSIRDGESILEQLSSFVEDEITEEDVFKLVGLLSNDFYFELLNKIAHNNLKGMIEELNRAIENGADPLEIYRGLVSFLRKVFLSHIGLKEDLLESSAEEIELLKSIKLDIPKLINLLETCLKFEETIRRSINSRIAIELLFTQLVSGYGILESRASKGHSNLLNPNGIKQNLISYIAQKNPRIGAAIHQAEIKISEGKINIKVNNEFHRNELTSNQELLKEIIKSFFNKEYNLNIETVETSQKPDGLVQKIKTMFDGEEVR
uniref:DNA polymerase III subunit gamma/tau n=1 Tax=candidate division WOR-3 bacterium TaxID=2052148 RepID=A0A7C4TB39_UNCW3